MECFTYSTNNNFGSSLKRKLDSVANGTKETMAAAVSYLALSCIKINRYSTFRQAILSDQKYSRMFVTASAFFPKHMNPRQLETLVKVGNYTDHPLMFAATPFANVDHLDRFWKGVCYYAWAMALPLLDLPELLMIVDNSDIEEVYKTNIHFGADARRGYNSRVSPDVDYDKFLIMQMNAWFTTVRDVERMYAVLRNQQHVMLGSVISSLYMFKRYDIMEFLLSKVKNPVMNCGIVCQPPSDDFIAKHKVIAVKQTIAHGRGEFTAIPDMVLMLGWAQLIKMGLFRVIPGAEPKRVKIGNGFKTVTPIGNAVKMLSMFHLRRLAKVMCPTKDLERMVNKKTRDFIRTTIRLYFNVE